MIRVLPFVLVVFMAASAWAQSTSPAQLRERREAEYYAAVYARHSRVPLALVRSVIERESNWRACAVSSKGATGLMQLMPATARRLGVRNRCDIQQNISGGVRYLAWLMRLFHNDFRLVAAAYYAGEDIVARHGLAYRNADVVAYVARMRATYQRQAGLEYSFKQNPSKRDMR
jgi:soluble lytic murein transglycosylase-like protein